MPAEGAAGRPTDGRGRFHLRRALWLAALVFALGLLAACSRGAGNGSSALLADNVDAGAAARTEQPAAREPNRPAAPDFTFTTFDGQQLSLADFKGQAVVLNFWASWCPPCRTEMPYFETTYRAYQDRGVVFIGLAIQDDPEASRAFLEELGITYPNGPDEGDEINRRYGLFGLPTTVFITRGGKIAQKWTGQLSEEQLIAFVEEIAR